MFENDENTSTPPLGAISLKLKDNHLSKGLKWLVGLLYPPSYDDFAKQRRANFQNTLLWIFIFSTVSGILSSFFYSTAATIPSLKLMWGNLLLYLIVLGLQHRNRLDQANGVFLFNLLVTAIGLGVIFPDSFVAAVVLTIAISLSGFLLRYRGVIVITGLSLVIMTMLHLVIAPQVNVDRILVELEMLACEGILLTIASRTIEKSDKEITKNRNALLETNQKLRTVLDHFPGFVFWKDRNSVYQGCNQAYAEAFQLNEPNDIIGKSEYDLLSSSTEADSYRVIDSQIGDTAVPKVGYFEQQIQMGGSIRWYEARKIPLSDGDDLVTGELDVWVDITERKDAKETLARRATNLETVAAISATISATLDSARLLQKISDVTKERFNLYHVHIYLIEGDALLLAAGAGEVGRKLVAGEHAIPIEAEKSLVARAARDRMGVIANDVKREADFLPNLLLPETRSEMALPLIVGETLLGVLDIQSNQINHFTQEDVNINIILARQVAVALQNARQYTELKQMKQTLSTSEARLSETMRLTKIGDWELDPEAQMFTFSDHFYAILHTTAEEQGGYQMAVEEYFQRFVHPDDLSFVRDEILENQSAHGQRYVAQNEHRILFADGGIGFVLAETIIIYDENDVVIRHYGSIQDITERKKIEIDLRHKQVHLSTAANMARLGYWEYDVERGLFTFDDHFYDIFHTTAVQQGGYQLSLTEYAQRFMPPETASGASDKIAQWFASTQQVSTGFFEHPVLYADGGEGYISVRVVVERNAEGHIVHAYGVNQDITDFVKNKKDLMNTNQKLEAALIQEKTMRTQLIQSERLSLVGQLMASVSHELNNPLQAIQNSLFLLKDEKKISAQGQQQMQILLSAAERMSILLEQVRASYRPTRPENFQSIQLNILIEDVATLIATYMRHREISLEFIPDFELPAIKGIPDQFRQVVLNLLMNAAEAMPSGGHITVRTQSLPEQDNILLSVADTGPGIASEFLSRIFEPFVTDKKAGTGLGLSITHDIVGQHGGTIQAENNPLGGAIFKILLPIEKAS